MQCAYMYTCRTVGTCTCQVAHFERFERDIAEAVARGGTTQPSAPELQRWCAFAGPSPGPIPMALALTPAPAQTLALTAGGSCYTAELLTDEYGPNPNQPTNQPTNHPTTQPPNHPTTQPPNRPTT